MKKFLSNFIISFLFFVIVDLLGIVTRPILSENWAVYNIMLDMDDWEQTISAAVLPSLNIWLGMLWKSKKI